MDGTSLLLGRMKSSLRSPETDIKLVVLSGRLEVAVLGRPPLLEEAPGIITVVRIRGIRR